MIELSTTATFDRGIPISRNRKVLVVVNEQGWESVVLQTDSKFWKLLRTRRKQSTSSEVISRNRRAPTS